MYPIPHVTHLKRWTHHKTGTFWRARTAYRTAQIQLSFVCFLELLLFFLFSMFLSFFPYFIFYFIYFLFLNSWTFVLAVTGAACDPGNTQTCGFLKKNLTCMCWPFQHDFGKLSESSLRVSEGPTKFLLFSYIFLTAFFVFVSFFHELFFKFVIIIWILKHFLKSMTIFKIREHYLNSRAFFNYVNILWIHKK